MMIFKSEPPLQTDMNETCDQKYNGWASEPSRIPPLLPLAHQLYGDTPTMTQIGMRELHMNIKDFVPPLRVACDW